MGQLGISGKAGLHWQEDSETVLCEITKAEKAAWTEGHSACDYFKIILVTGL